MPIKIPDKLPAKEVLENENIFVMTEQRAMHQDIRPLKIIILNLMPTKIVTETQLIRALSNTPLQIELTLLQTVTYTPKNTPISHLSEFYKSFDEVKALKYDGMIITGAPVENMEFSDVGYWDELCSIMEWTKTNVYSTLHICWGAQAGLNYHYNIPKYPLSKKMFGIFAHKVTDATAPLFRGFSEYFYAPHSRHTEIRQNDIEKDSRLRLLSISDEAGVYIVSANSGRQIFVTGHPEYDTSTLSEEYFRDVEKGLDIELPKNYFPENNPKNPPINKWRAHSTLLYTNWLNYYVYQATPYNVDEIE